MKKIILTAAMAIFAIAAYAQTKTTIDANVNAKSNKGKSTEMKAKAKADADISQYDLDMDGELSASEKAARKTARKEESRVRKTDRQDDGILNGSANDNNLHGKTVSEIATTTTLEGREKGAEISAAARSKANANLDLDGVLSPEDKAARKEARKQENKTRKADRADDGLLNGSSDANIHGKTTSGVAVGTTIKGKAKGAEISTGAKAKVKPGKGINVSAGKKARIGL